MKTLLKEDLAKLDKEFNDQEFPILGLGAAVIAVVFVGLMLYSFDLQELGRGEIIGLVILGIGLAVCVGRQVCDLPLFYLLGSFKGKYNTLEEQESITYDVTKHVARSVYILIYTVLLYAFHASMNFYIFFPTLISLFLLPMFYRILANVLVQKKKNKAKMHPVKRVSADGEVDLTNLSFLHENVDNHVITNPKIKQLVKELQGLLDYVTLRIALVDDVETAHTLKRMGEEELPRLVQEFESLEAELQASYEEKTLGYLHLLKDKLLAYKEEVNTKKSQQIQTTFSLLDERYKS